jgi:TolB protein
MYAISRIFLPVLLAIAALGCGGGSTGGPPPAAGNVQVQIDWPSRGRYVPSYANSIVARITTPNNRQYSLTINRSGSDAYQGVAMFAQSIAIGTSSLTVDAYTNANGSGSKVATATVAVEVTDGEVTNVNISADLTSTIDHIVIQGQPLSVQAGNQLQLNAVARNAQNQTILLPAGVLVWSVVAGQAHGSVTTSGLFTGLSGGTSTVQVAETGAGVQQQANVTVTPPPPPPAVYRIVFLSDRDDVGSEGVNAIYTVNSNGTGLARLTTEHALFRSPSLSPDGTQIVFASDKDVVLSDEIYVMPSSGGVATRLTTNTVFDADPVFSPNGQKIAFARLINGFWQIFTMNANGTSQVQITSANANHSRPSWSPDGSKIAYESDAGGDYEIWVMNADGSGKTQLTTNSVDDLAPSFSPDGSKIVFVSYRVSGGDLYTMNANGSSQTRLVALSGAEDDPSWTSDGLGIVFAKDLGSGFFDIWFVKADGTGSINITNDPYNNTHPTAIVLP